jgi:lipid-A-disaccharide synthase
VFIGVDAPDFNLGLEKALKQHGIPTVHYVSPSIWAWRGERIHKIGAAVSRVLALFPFEPALYEKQGIPVSYVGHPLADMLPLEDGREGARTLLGLSAQEPVFALLPGSRQSELQYMADTFIETARRIHDEIPEAVFLVPLATRETRALFEGALHRCSAQQLPIRLLFGHAHQAMMAADVVLVASGTATLEAALLKRPMVIAYKMAPLSYRNDAAHRRLSALRGLPNVLAGQFVVPEFIQDDATPENLAQALLNLYADRTVCARLKAAFRRCICNCGRMPPRRRRQPFISCLPARCATMLALLQAEGLVCGVDEAGRGPLAGPVVAAAVILDPARPIAGLNDSKKLSAGRRRWRLPRDPAERWPGRWRQRASRRSTASTSCRPACWPCSAPSPRSLPAHRTCSPSRCWSMAIVARTAYPVSAIVGGDGKIAAIAAASILAKTVRDAGMLELHAAYPQYGFDRHMGYPTAQHLQALGEHGASPHHRRSFGPVARSASHETDRLARQSALQGAEETLRERPRAAQERSRAARRHAPDRGLRPALRGARRNLVSDSGAGRPESLLPGRPASRQPRDLLPDALFATWPWSIPRAASWPSSLAAAGTSLDHAADTVLLDGSGSRQRRFDPAQRGGRRFSPDPAVRRLRAGLVAEDAARGDGCAFSARHPRGLRPGRFSCAYRGQAVATALAASVSSLCGQARRTAGLGLRQRRAGRAACSTGRDPAAAAHPDARRDRIAECRCGGCDLPVRDGPASQGWLNPCGQRPDPGQ